jgi:hypothetical protein
MHPFRRRFPGTIAASIACAVAGGASCSSKPPAATYMTREQLLDPTTCTTCHVDHFTDWSGSMHAYASDDPVFVAMNKRGQRETGGKLGSFCVQCHAPMALREGATTDGQNLDQVPQKLKGITCFFCHTVDQADGTSNDPLHLSGDIVMRGPLADPVANTAHPAIYSRIHDGKQLDSVKFCGTCHDVVNGNQIAIERTYQEWQGTIYSHTPNGEPCTFCHMYSSKKPVAQAPNVFAREYHSHDFPGVDLALSPFPQQEAQKQGVQALLDMPTLVSEVCVGQGTGGIHVALENFSAGHSFPSGAAQDRRAWVEVIAYATDATGKENVIYQSGVVPNGVAVTGINDPDLWLLREQMLDASGQPVSMFWQAASPPQCTLIPGQVTSNPLDPAVYTNHVYQIYPRTTQLTTAPDKVTMRVRFQPIGLDVIDDLVATHDLDPSIGPTIATFDMGPDPLVTWTAATAASVYMFNGVQFSCVSNTHFNPQSCLPGSQEPTCSLVKAHGACQ